mmetsp:Transcript_2448/g.5715  ORF Transcript_2448/g.5715 Transcript_2448/m.5715 type:complete len:221 (-) Transcript_2448:858-1520(-)
MYGETASNADCLTQMRRLTSLSTNASSSRSFTDSAQLGLTSSNAQTASRVNNMPRGGSAESFALAMSALESLRNASVAKTSSGSASCTTTSHPRSEASEPTSIQLMSLTESQLLRLSTESERCRANGFKGSDERGFSVGRAFHAANHRTCCCHALSTGGHLPSEGQATDAAPRFARSSYSAASCALSRTDRARLSSSDASRSNTGITSSPQRAFQGFSKC